MYVFLSKYQTGTIKVVPISGTVNVGGVATLLNIFRRVFGRLRSFQTEITRIGEILYNIII